MLSTNQAICYLYRFPGTDVTIRTYDISVMLGCFVDGAPRTIFITGVYAIIIKPSSLINKQPV
jgi:hypothetical protein